MSDQTDIEPFTIEETGGLFALYWNGGTYVWGFAPSDKHTAERLCAALNKRATEVSKLRDEETARLKGEIVKVNEFRERAYAKHREVRDQRDQYHSASLQLAESIKDLQARLAEAEVWYNLGKLAVAIANGNAITGSARELDDNPVNCVSVLVKRLSDATTKQLALESQCQRMRDLLEEWVSRVPVMPGDPQRVTYNKTNALLSAPLDLELLNRVRSFISDVHDCMPCRESEELMTSLSPAT